MLRGYTETAAEKINELLAEENKAGSGLRVFVQGGGCSGFQYGLMIEENGQGSGGDDGTTDRQSVQSVGKIHCITRSHDDQHYKCNERKER